MKRKLSIALIFALTISSFPLISCTPNENNASRGENVLRIASWDEYIDEGGEDSYIPDSKPLYEEFEAWYEKNTGKKIKVEYISLQDNETMYNKIKMGDSYDLICPSEYMIMKLADEDLLQPLPSTFFEKSNENNYYANNLSPYIREVFENETFTAGGKERKLNEYAAGYMWGTTGFIYNPEKISPEIMKDWDCLLSPSCNRQITVKDSVRDSYFAGLGMYYQDQLNELKADYENGKIEKEDYRKKLSILMNMTDDTTIAGARGKLEQMRKNLYGIETDEAKSEIIMGRLDASYQWSGDAVYILDEIESYSEDNPLLLEYAIPQSASNLWFDGWALMKTCKNVDAATAFINFVSMPENVVRNMYYIGYTSCIASDEVFEYVQETYGSEEEDAVSYDLSYFFGENKILTTSKEQTKRQLFAQYPDENTIDRLVVMKYFNKETNEKLNRMWTTIK